ncbi:MAG: hypothetical protein ACUVQX_04620 [Candidatus Bathycorpusculaceae bacterium]
MEENSAKIEANPKSEVEVDVKALEVKVPKEKEMLQMPPKAHVCAHHFGYLSERKTKEKIPEECIMCENIVQCMLKNVTT